MVKWQLVIFCLFTSLKLSAQQKPHSFVIKAVVVDSATDKPLSFVTVILKNRATGQAVKSMLTKDDGSFELLVAKDQYKLSLAYTGYLPRIISITDSNTRADLGKILMIATKQQLNEVAIVADKPLLTKEIDRISFDVQADPESKSNDALEMLRKVPMITVDGNDIIQLKGSNKFQIFINGKPSALMINSPSDVLKAMPAATIKKIEVITIPPSKYDGEGLAGIINIITVKRTEQGMNGSLFGRYNNIYGERSSLSLNVKEDKFGMNLLLGSGHQPINTQEQSARLTTYSPTSILTQDGFLKTGGNFNNGRADLSFEADSLHLLTGIVDFTNRRFASDPTLNSQLMTSSAGISQSYLLNSIGENNTGAFDLGLSYQLGFSKNRKELLTFAYQYSWSSYFQNSTATISDPFNYSGTNYLQQNNTGTKENTFQVDFIDPVKNWVIEAGTKMILRDNQSDFYGTNQDPSSGQYLVDTALTNRFDYHQDVYSLYNTYQLKVRDWTFKGGARIEYTSILAGLSAGNTFPDQHYLNLIPALSIQRDLKEQGIVSLGFAERIERPGIKQLNPFIDKTDPEFIIVGNPELRPVVNHLAELSYSRFGAVSFNASLNYAFANNTVQTVTSVVSDTLTRSTYLNAGKDRSAGFNLSINYPVTPQLTLNINSQLAHAWISGIYDQELYHNQGNRGNAGAFARYNFNSDLNATINWGYNSGMLYLQGKTSDFYFSSFNMIKDFDHKKFTVSLTVYEPYRQYRNMSAYTITPAFEQSNSTQNFARYMRLALNYKFGKTKAIQAVRKPVIRNDDVKSNTSGGEN